jgi:hypothetical protein
MQNAEFRTLDSVGAPDVILPSQYFGAMLDGALCGEQRLMLAVLADAINVLQVREPIATARKRKAFDEAAKWVITAGNRDPFSFDNVCDGLNIAPELLRERLRGLALRHGSTGWHGPRHLRLHGLNRMQHMMPNRVRRKAQRPVSQR